MLEENENDLDHLDNVLKEVEVDNQLPSVEYDIERIPQMTDPDWSDYVLKQFTEDEQIDGNPTVDGLRRVTKKLLGDIISSRCRVIQAPNPSNNYSSTVEHEVVIRWLKLESGEDVHERVFTEVADVNEQNCEPEFRRFSSSTASTRAEARALRKALMLKRVVAAEEITQIAPVDENNSDRAGKITKGQINFIKNLAIRNDINIMKYINMGKQKYESIEDVDYQTALKMVGHLSKLQREGVPENIKGYKSDYYKSDSTKN